MRPFLIMLVFLLLLPGDALSEPAPMIPCGDRGKIIDQLQTKYSEAPVSIGIMANGSVIEIYVSDEGTFTVLITNPAGATCLVASGNSWEQIKSEPEGIEM